MKKIILILCLLKIINVHAQQEVTHITYKSSMNLGKQKTNLEDVKDEELGFYTDVFFYEDKVRSKMRNKSSNPFVAVIKDFIYTQGARNMFSLDESRGIAFEVKIPIAQLTKTGRSKKILDHLCYEWEDPKYKIQYWITDEITVNISPTGNMGILGTVLEYISPFGNYHLATSISKEKIKATDFELPTGYSTMESNFSFSKLEEERKKWKDKQFPAFELVDMNGKKYTNESLKGKIVVINFWFTTCKPCIGEMPELNALAAMYKNRNDIVFLGIAPDNKERITEFLKKKNFDYTIVHGASDVIQMLGVNAFPTNMVLDKEGYIRYESTGFKGNAGENKDKLMQVINTLAPGN